MRSSIWLSSRPKGRSVREFERVAGPLLVRALCGSARESRTLAAIRDALLPKLVSGELRVGDAERFVGGVA